MTAAQEEMLETEAILMAPPGAVPLGWDYDDEQLAPMTNGTEPEGNEGDPDELETLKDLHEAPEDLEVLEMDLDDDTDTDTESPASQSPVLESPSDSDVKGGEDGSVDATDALNDSGDDEKAEDPGDQVNSSSGSTEVTNGDEEDILKVDANVENEIQLTVPGADESNNTGNADVTEETSPEPDTEEAKASDMIQPIFLEDLSIEDREDDSEDSEVQASSKENEAAPSTDTDNDEQPSDSTDNEKNKRKKGSYF
jgi:hypothetical protein